MTNTFKAICALFANRTAYNLECSLPSVAELKTCSPDNPLTDILWRVLTDIQIYALFMILRVFLFIHKYHNKMLKAYWPIKFDFPWANWNLGIWIESYRHFLAQIALICSKDHSHFQWSIWLPFRNVLHREGSKKKESVIVVLVNSKHTRNQLFLCWKTLSSISFIHIFCKYLSCINSSRGSEYVRVSSVLENVFMHDSRWKHM